MIEENENPVRKFDPSRYDIYTIKEAVDVCAIQLNEDITAMLKVQGVARAEWEHHITTYASGKKDDYKVLKYIIADKGTAYPGDWLVWNGNYLQIMFDAEFKQKYKPKRAKNTK